MLERFPIEAVRGQFPSLSLRDDGVARVYADNPAGTQVPKRVADAAAQTLLFSNANLGGAFRTSIAAEAIVQTAHDAMARFLNAGSAREIVIAQSMTNPTFHLSRSLGRRFQRGDEIIVTRMDHDGNVAPWLMLAQDLDLRVRWVDIDAESWLIEPEALARELSDKTKLVALNYASNVTGSINDVATLTALAKQSGALVYLDAVQFAPHGLVDVQRIGCDFLACSSYKFFGPHLGIVWGREALLEELDAYKVRPATTELPWKWETGTPQIELQAALSASVAYVEWLATLIDPLAAGRTALQDAYAASEVYERGLTATLIDGLRASNNVSIHGIVEPALYSQRVPTVSFTHRSRSSHDIARHLAAQNIFVWAGNNYALELVRALGIDEDDGVVRIGLAHYNTAEEVERILDVLQPLL